MNRMIRWATTNWRSGWFYNQLRPQERLGNLSPEHYAQQQARELTGS
jgi:transposase InsO family protein